MTRGETKTGCTTSTSASAVNPNAWKSMLDKIVHDNKHAGISEDSTRNTSMSTDFIVPTKGREEHVSLS